MQLESIHHLKASSLVESDGGLIARTDHHMGGVLSLPADLEEKRLNQERAGPPSSGSRIHGNSQQLRTLTGTTAGAVTEGLKNPTPRPEEPPTAGKGGRRSVTPQKRPIEGGHISGAREESHRGLLLLDDEQE
jgi:hypothetical protein